MPSYERVRHVYLRSAQTFENPARAARLATLTSADVLHTRVGSGTPALVTERLSMLRQEVGLSGIIMEPNSGGRLLYERLLHSMRLFTQEVAPSVRETLRVRSPVVLCRPSQGHAPPLGMREEQRPQRRALED
jgi:hypothetical protein